jgi:hypothetical protein
VEQSEVDGKDKRGMSTCMDKTGINRDEHRDETGIKQG